MKGKKLISVLCAAAMTLALFAGCAPQGSETTQPVTTGTTAPAETNSDLTGEPIKTVAIFTDRAAIGQELIRCVELFKDEYGIELVATVLTPRSSIPLPCSNTHSVPQNDQPAAETRQADCKRSAPPGSAGAAI